MRTPTEHAKREATKQDKKQANACRVASLPDISIFWGGPHWYQWSQAQIQGCRTIVVVIIIIKSWSLSPFHHHHHHHHDHHHHSPTFWPLFSIKLLRAPTPQFSFTSLKFSYELKILYKSSNLGTHYWSQGRMINVTPRHTCFKQSFTNKTL